MVSIRRGHRELIVDDTIDLHQSIIDSTNPSMVVCIFGFHESGEIC